MRFVRPVRLFPRRPPTDVVFGHGRRATPGDRSPQNELRLRGPVSDPSPMSARRVAFATFSGFPHGTPDDAPALEALRIRGIDAAAEIWDSPVVDWSTYDAVILRSTWDYHHRPAVFSAWLHSVRKTSRVWNSLDLVRWNLHKSYLVELIGRGRPVVPTELLRQGSEASLRSIRSDRGWDEVVIKPAVGAASYEFFRAASDNLDAGEAHLRKLARAGDVLVQPYLSFADTRGERSLVYIDGLFSHAVRYASVIAEPTRTPVAIAPDRETLDESARVLAGLSEVPLYARLDYLPSAEDGWKLGELELVEPELFFTTCAGAPDRFASAVLRRLNAET